MEESNINIKVSVVVTTFNQEDTIARTLDSILAQECDFPFEICLSDDCSTDGNHDVCSDYARRYPHIIRYQRNVRNRGPRDNYFDTLLRCRGKYIADCAGDDYWTDPLKLARQAAVLDSDPEITLVHTNWEFRNAFTGEITPSDPSGEKQPYLKPVSQPGELFIPVLQHKGHAIIHFCTAMYRKDVFIREYEADPHLFRSPEFPCEDLQLMVLYAKAGKIAYLPVKTMHYSVGHQSVSSLHNSIKTFDFYTGSLKLTVYLAEKFNVPMQVMAQTYRDLTSFTFAHAYMAHDKQRLSSLISFIKQKHLPLSLKTRILIPTIAVQPLWRLCAAIKKARLANK